MTENLKYMRRKRAQGCKIHTEIKDAAIEELAQHGVFNKSDLLEELGLTLVEGSIRWDYIIEFIEKDMKVTLTPLAKSFFSRQEQKKMKEVNDQEAIYYPFKMIAGGHSRRTHGYCRADFDGGRFAVTRFEGWEKRVRGQVDSMNKKRGTVRKELQQSLGEDAPALPDSTLTRGEQ